MRGSGERRAHTACPLDKVSMADTFAKPLLGVKGPGSVLASALVRDDAVIASQRVRANAHPMTGSLKQSIAPLAEAWMLRRLRSSQ
jgi:hypothetical protein